MEIRAKQEWRNKEAQFIRKTRREIDQIRAVACTCTICQEEESEDQIKFRFSAVTLIICIIFLAICLIFGCARTAHAVQIPEERAIKAIIGEAESEGSKGMLAIACAISNRGTLSGVYGEKSPRVAAKKYSNETYLLAKNNWRRATEHPESCAFVDGADHWGSKKVDGGWIQKMKKMGFVKTCEYRGHEFYRRGKR